MSSDKASSTDCGTAFEPSRCRASLPRSARVPAIEGRLGLDQALVREVERLAVVCRQQQQADHLAGILVQQLVHGEEVAERLAHLLAGDVQEAVVHPVRRHDGVAEGAAALRDLVLVVREDEVETAGMDVEGLRPEACCSWPSTRCASPAGRGPTDCPSPAAAASTASTARSRPDPSCRARRRRAAPADQLVARMARQAAVVAHARHAEQHMALGGVGMTAARSGVRSCRSSARHTRWRAARNRARARPAGRMSLL